MQVLQLIDASLCDGQDARGSHRIVHCSVEPFLILEDELHTDDAAGAEDVKDLAGRLPIGDHDVNHAGEDDVHVARSLADLKEQLVRLHIVLF